MSIEPSGHQPSYTKLPNNRVLKSFWTLNDEMKPRYKVTFIREIDATGMDRLRSRLEEETGSKPSYTAIITKAASMVLQEFPYANRAILGLPFFQRLVQFQGTDITVAVERNVPDAEAVVLADTIRDVSAKDLTTLTRELRGFSQATEENNDRWRLFFNLLDRVPTFLCKWLIRMPRFFPKFWVEHRGGACFVNSPARYGVDMIVGDMLWPVTVSFGWVRERPIVIDGKVCARRTLPLFLIFDRRIMAGVPAAKFFNRLAEILQDPERELS